MESRTLKDILDGDNDVEVQDSENNNNLGDLDHLDQAEDENKSDPDLCNECQDMRIEVECKDCEENYGGGCFE